MLGTLAWDREEVAWQHPAASPNALQGMLCLTALPHLPQGSGLEENLSNQV